jgi:arginine utilization protein RocB
MMNIRDEIEKTLKEYVALDSITNTYRENSIDGFLKEYFESIEYFKENPDDFGSEKIPGDIHNRSVNWALLRGKGEKTVVFIHHSDVVNVENYNEYKKNAFDPDQLCEAFEMSSDALDSEAVDDLNSGRWMFGRGTADMKGGGAIQLSLMKEISKDEDRIGNIIVLAVPDEENLSAGMRHGVKILRRLKEKHGLDYQLMINSEPHQRVDYDKGMISQGSIAKMNFFVYVKGILTHAGKILEGINPSGIMSRIVSRIELNLDFIDEIEGEMSIPPTWVHVKDSKEVYDISTPESTIGYLNVLNFATSPEEVMKKIMDICVEESDEFMKKYSDVRAVFMEKTNRKSIGNDWPVHVVTFNELLDILKEKGEEYYKKYDEFEKKIIDDLRFNKMSFVNANYELVEYIIKLINRQEMFIVAGMTMPLYPGVSNLFQEDVSDYLDIINKFTSKEWNQEYMNRYYFTGISDLSYSSLNYDIESTVSQMENMPLWKKYYDIPFEDIKEIQMPCINIGPWGKDFHKISERVYKEDLFERTPRIIEHVMEYLFKN